MALPIPKLDDKTFDELVEEARTLIARYAPEWTDHNIHDPGITLIELFAWLAEMQFFQLDQITARHRQTFLKLMSVTPRPIQPARTHIHFDVKEGTPGALIKAGTKLTPIGNERLVFETEEDLFLTDNSLESVTTHINTTVIDHTQANRHGNVYFYPFGENNLKEAYFQLQFRSGLEESGFSLSVQVSADELSDAPGDKREPVPGVRMVKLVWEFWCRGSWCGLGVKKDTTNSLIKNGRISFRTSDDDCQKPEQEPLRIRCRIADGSYEIAPRIKKIDLNRIAVVQVETAMEERLGSGDETPGQTVKLQKAPIYTQGPENASRLYAGDILNWRNFAKKMLEDTSGPVERIRRFIDRQSLTLLSDDDLLDDGDVQYDVVAALNRLLESRELYQGGAFADIDIPPEYHDLIGRLTNNISPAEIKRLNRFLFESAFADQVVRRNMIVQVQDADGNWRDWTRVEDFNDSGPDDPHYTLEPKEGKITFGNGLNGQIPQPYQQIRARFYKTCLGPVGNLPPGQIWNFLEPQLSAYRGENREPAGGGRAEESLEDAELRARRNFNTTYRAITAEDFERLALSTPGLQAARAKTLLNYHPDYPFATVPGSITVVVVPCAMPQQIAPQPGEEFRRTIKNYLNSHRLITTNVHVIAPTYVKVSVCCRLQVKMRYDDATVRNRVREALQNYLHPLTGGPDQKGWPFGRSVYPSEIYQVIDVVEGVEYASNVSLSCQGNGQETEGTIRLPPSALVCSGDHRIEERPAKDGNDCTGV
ncbi:FIG01122338: hypothetical protein [Olavius sp. associated proteobacterium Delta 1]|nr:FIG01122338: hypothetical protein [Olavius sp. associated proteobacterium Delta 1]